MISQSYFREAATEATSHLEESCSELLGRFARSRPNDMRIEIRLFRLLLGEIAERLEQRRELEELAHRLRWWELSWYEREYADSEFEELTSQEETALNQQQLKLYKSYVSLWIITVDPKILADEIRHAATNPPGFLYSLSIASPSPSLADLAFLLRKTIGNQQKFLLNTIASALRGSNPSNYSAIFLDFLLSIKEFGFSVCWSNCTTSDDSFPCELIIKVPTPSGSSEVRSTGKLSSDVLAWVTKLDVDHESKESWIELRDRLRKKAA